jgi:hypothetical protein
VDISLTSVEIWLLLIILVLWALLLFGSFAFRKPDAENTHRIPRWARMASSFCLVLGAWLWFGIARDPQVANPALWLAIGMSLGFVGDLFMAKLIPLQPHVLYGMGAFGLGHIAYIIGMAQFSSVQQFAFPNWTAFAFWWIVAVVGWYVLVFRGSKASLLHYVALPYALLLASTAAAATGLALMDASFLLLVIGAILFLLSDLILAAQLFNGLKFPLIGDVVWLTYGPAQMLIVFGLFLMTIVHSF